MLRITRLTRALRLERLLRFVSALRTLVHSIYVTLKSLAWAMLLLVIIMYVFGITFSQVAIDYIELEGYRISEQEVETLLGFWGNVYRSMNTLFQSISNGVGWGEAYRSIEAISVPYALILTAYVAFTQLAVLNVVTAVFCSTAIEATERNPAIIAHTLMAKKAAYMDNLKNLFKTIDAEESGLITLDVLELLLEAEQTRAYFSALQLDISDAWTLFKLIDKDNDGVIEIEEFVEGCEQLRGAARNLDLANIKSELRNLGKAVARFIQHATLQFDLLISRSDVEMIEGPERANESSEMPECLHAPCSGNFSV